MKRAIVLAGDNGYMEKLEVTIKSIVATNSQIIFYVINDNLPQVLVDGEKIRVCSITNSEY